MGIIYAITGILSSYFFLEPANNIPILVCERQIEGIELAKRSRKYKGRKPKLNAGELSRAKKRLAAGVCVATLANEYGVNRMTIYRWKEM